MASKELKIVMWILIVGAAFTGGLIGIGAVALQELRKPEWRCERIIEEAMTVDTYQFCVSYLGV